MKFKERMKITKRGYQIIGKYCPGLIRAKVIAAGVETLSPFVTIWFSARIINEIAGEADKGRLLLYVLLTIGIQCIFSMTKNAFDKVIHEKESSMWSYFPKIFADKQMTMETESRREPLHVRKWSGAADLGHSGTCESHRGDPFRNLHDRRPVFIKNRRDSVGFLFLDTWNGSDHDSFRHCQCQA